tara:strand:- start:4323 stop:4799 length:477 start_codon:yes stop_codon:yes gene_type:complete
MSRISAYNAATMTVTVTEAITLNSKDYGSTQNFTVSSVANVSKRMVTVTTSEAAVLAFAAAAAAGTHVIANVQYLRFTNLDDTNFIVLTFANEDDDEFAVKVDAGRSFIMAGDIAGGGADLIDAKDSALSLSLGDLKSVTADADTASCDMEIFIAETA